MSRPLQLVDPSWWDVLAPSALQGVLHHPRVHRDPSPLPAFGEDERVMVVGTGPCAVDALRALSDRGHVGRTVAVSWDAEWPLGQALTPLREALVLVDRAAEILEVRAFSCGFVVWLRLTGADVASRAGAVEVWNVDRIVICDDDPGLARAS